MYKNKIVWQFIAKFLEGGEKVEENNVEGVLTSRPVQTKQRAHRGVLFIV